MLILMKTISKIKKDSEIHTPKYCFRLIITFQDKQSMIGCI